MDLGQIFNWVIDNRESIYGVVGIVGFLVARYIPALPKLAKSWLDKLGGEAKIRDILIKAAEFTACDDTHKRLFAVGKIKELAIDNGFYKTDKQGVKICIIPDSIINLLVEWILGRLKIKGKL
jgi:hypothetical protein